MSSSKSAILFAVSSLGLGHATRMVPIIRDFEKRGFVIHILSSGKALQYLKCEIKNGHFYELKDYPPMERGKGLLFYYYIVPDIFAVLFRIRSERHYTEKLIDEEGIDIIFSDGRFGVYSKKKPSFFLTHQTQFHMHPLNVWFSPIANYFNYRKFQKFDHIFIADFEEEKYSLAGKLSHARFLKKLPHSYIGILSSLEKKDIPVDIDYLFTISGFLTEYRDSFIKVLYEQAKSLPGEKVFILGDPYSKKVNRDEENNITIYDHVSGDERADLFNRARVIVSRCGYTTLMDVVELSKKALLVPTPNQSEQVYISSRLKKKGFFLTIPHTEANNLLEYIKNADHAPLFDPPTKTHEAVGLVRKKINEYSRRKGL
jgi:UDP-N-acetylglucosamine:LPS N-acetylglucosamine transferase